MTILHAGWRLAHIALAVALLGRPCCQAAAAVEGGGDEAVKVWYATLVVNNLNGGGSGNVTVRVHPEWAPIGAARFAELIGEGFFDDVRFFRVIQGFMAQFGISGDPQVARQWRAATLKDDPVLEKNLRGRLTFATGGKNTRTTQIFVNFRDNNFLDSQGFSPFAEVVEPGMAVVDRLYSGYGEGAPQGRGPNQGRVQAQGNKYLRDEFPLLSYIEHAELHSAGVPVEELEAAATGAGAAGASSGSGLGAVLAIATLLCCGGMALLYFGACGSQGSSGSGTQSPVEVEGEVLQGAEMTIGRKRVHGLD